MMKVFRWLLCVLVAIGLLLLIEPADSITPSFVQRAEEYRAAIDYRLAADYLRAALVRQPWNAALHIKLAEALLLQHDTAGARQALSGAERRGAEFGSLERLRALLAEADQQFAEAAQHWLKVIQRQPFDEAAYAAAIAAALRAEQWSAAQTAAEQWVARRNSPEAHLALGQLLALDDPAAALEHLRLGGERAQPYELAVQQADRGWQLMLLGRAYLAQNQLELAQRAFDKAIGLQPEYAEAQAFAGFVRDQRGADGGAWLDRAVALDPALSVARYFRARHRWAQADLAGAITDLQAALQHDPANALLVAELGRVYTQHGDFNDAEQWLTRARNLRPQDVAIWKSLAELYIGRSLGSAEQMVATARMIVDLAPEDAEAHVWLGRAYLQSGDRGGAELELNEAVRLDPHSTLAHFYLGHLYGHATEAGRAEYERALMLDPGGPIGLAAQRALELP